MPLIRRIGDFPSFWNHSTVPLTALYSGIWILSTPHIEYYGFCFRIVLSPILAGNYAFYSLKNCQENSPCQEKYPWFALPRYRFPCFTQKNFYGTTTHIDLSRYSVKRPPKTQLKSLLQELSWDRKGKEQIIISTQSMYPLTGEIQRNSQISPPTFKKLYMTDKTVFSYSFLLQDPFVGALDPHVSGHTPCAGMTKAWWLDCYEPQHKLRWLFGRLPARGRFLSILDPRFIEVNSWSPCIILRRNFWKASNCT